MIHFPFRIGQGVASSDHANIALQQAVLQSVTAVLTTDANNVSFNALIDNIKENHWFIGNIDATIVGDISTEERNKLQHDLATALSIDDSQLTIKIHDDNHGGVFYKEFINNDHGGVFYVFLNTLLYFELQH